MNLFLELEENFQFKGNTKIMSVLLLLLILLLLMMLFFILKYLKNIFGKKNILVLNSIILNERFSLNHKVKLIFSDKNNNYVINRKGMFLPFFIKIGEKYKVNIEAKTSNLFFDIHVKYLNIIFILLLIFGTILISFLFDFERIGQIFFSILSMIFISVFCILKIMVYRKYYKDNLKTRAFLIEKITKKAEEGGFIHYCIVEYLDKQNNKFTGSIGPFHSDYFMSAKQVDINYLEQIQNSPMYELSKKTKYFYILLLLNIIFWSVGISIFFSNMLS